MTATETPVTIPSEEEFLAEAKRFLDEHARIRRGSASAWGEGSDRVAVLEAVATPEQQRLAVDRARAWQAALFDAGYGWVSGPPQYGGRGLPRRYEQMFGELASTYTVADLRPLVVGLRIIAPAILEHGTPELKRDYLPALHRGHIVGCQLFSEPDAGSDLASVKTRARRDGDHWIVTGQKVWTSNGHFADVGEALVRTDPELPTHAGLTMLLVDMCAPGMTVRPLRQMTGGAEFNEVFLDEVRVADTQRIGDVGGGWRVVLTSMMSERTLMGNGGDTLPADLMWRLRELVAHLGGASDPNIRRLFADVYARFEVLRVMNLRMRARGNSDCPGPEASVAKLLANRNLHSITALLTEVLGPRLAADSGEWGTYAWSEFVLGAPALRIAGGTDEIHRNIIAERMLGLPKEPRP